MCVCAADDRAQGKQVVGGWCGFRELVEPADVVCVEVVLVHGLGSAAVVECGGAVGGEHDERDVGLVGFADGREVVGGGGSTGAEECDRFVGGLGDAEGEECGGAFVDD